MAAFYNENDPKAAAWLRELIAQGFIADGVVDERSIEDITPVELSAFTQVHLFAGVGGWSLALRQAGWPDDRPAWTGSCPCQPFSGAGKGKGFADERHLWPVMFHLIEQCEPVRVFGEQVEGKSGLAWFDLVQADMEAMGYACGGVVAPAAGFGAPHIRHRLYWMAHPATERYDGRGASQTSNEPSAQQRPERFCNAGGLDNTTSSRHTPSRKGAESKARDEARLRRLEPGRHAGRMGDAYSAGSQPGRTSTKTSRYGNSANPEGSFIGSGPINGFWRAADWIGCTDGKWRPVEPGTFPLATGVSARVVKLRGYGNAINIEQATAFIEAAMETLEQPTRPMEAQQ
ncbi:MAG: DNA cytosine methyltransferase [Sphingomonadales bacterium]